MGCNSGEIYAYSWPFIGGGGLPIDIDRYGRTPTQAPIRVVFGCP